MTTDEITPVTSVAIKEPHYERVGLASLGASGGVLAIQSMAEAVSVAQLMAKSGIAIRKHLRDNPGACLGVLMQALRWEMDPYMVGNKSYAVNDQLAYEAQLVAAVVLTRASVVNEPDYDYAGEGQTRTCTVTFKMRSGKTLSYTTPELGQIKVQNSPLWKSDPDQQLGYFAIRSWARRHQPHVLLGVYTVEEAHEIIDVTPGTSGVASRLPGAQNGAGFSHEGVQAETERAAPKAGRGGRKPKPPGEPEEAMHAAVEPEEAQPTTEEPESPQPETDAVLATPASGDQGDGWAVDESQQDGAEALTSGSVTGPTAQTDASPSEIPPDMQTFIDAVDTAATFVEVRQAMAVFFKTEMFSGLTLDQQNHIRYQTWMTLQDRKDAGDFTDLPDHAVNVTAFRLWLEAQDDPEAIAGTLATLERQPAFSEAAESTQTAVRKAAADRVEAVR